MSTSYKGMRWLKCGLHMHTPADTLHWRGTPIEVGNEATAAKAFADVCHRQDCPMPTEGFALKAFAASVIFLYLIANH